MSTSDLNQLSLGASAGSRVPKAKGNPISLSAIKTTPKEVGPSDLTNIKPTVSEDPADLYGIWSVDPTPTNLGNILASLQPQINKSISALVPNPSPSINAKARLLAIKAIQTYQADSPAKLTSWVYTSLQPLTRYAQQAAPVAVSERMRRQQAELHKVEGDFYDNHNRYPSDRELSDLMGVSKGQLGKIRKYNKVSLHEMDQFGSDPENSATASETVGTVLDRTEEIIDLFYDSLSPSEQSILEHRLGLRGKDILSNSAVALKVNLSPARVSQVANELADRLDDFKELAEDIL